MKHVGNEMTDKMNNFNDATQNYFIFYMSNIACSWCFKMME